MTNADLAKSYVWKAETRIDALEALLKRGNYSDVVREAQETVELASKGMLRAVGVEPPSILMWEYCFWSTETGSPRMFPWIYRGPRKYPSVFERSEKWLSMETWISFQLKNIQRMTLNWRYPKQNG